MEQSELTDGSETRAKITPYAFRIAPQLLNLPLARPWRRGVAMLIDLTLIGGAASLLTEEWAIVIFTVLWLIQRSLHGMTKRLALISTFFAIVIAAVLWGEHEHPASKQQVSDAVSLVGQLPELIALENCFDEQCADKAARKLKKSLAESQLPADVQYATLQSAMQESALDKQRAAELLGPPPQTSVTTAPDTEQSPEQAAEQLGPDEPQIPTVEVAEQIDIGEDDTCIDNMSPLALLKGLLKDFGLGFGWAIAYFSILTCWFNGQTIGKRLARIRVVRLDGKPLTMWGCFGRYGGYSAGLATGLLGFLQIYWDPNRQAIQDKISATAVIYRSPRSAPSSNVSQPDSEQQANES